MTNRLSRRRAAKTSPPPRKPGAARAPETRAEVEAMYTDMIAENARQLGEILLLAQRVVAAAREVGVRPNGAFPGAAPKAARDPWRPDPYG